MVKRYSPFLLVLCVFLSASCRRARRHLYHESYKITQNSNESESITIIGSPDTTSYKYNCHEDFLLKQIITKDIPSIELIRKVYIVSYNKDTKIPNWVAWKLTAEHADGDVPRFRRYLEDEEVPEPRATDRDYRKSGWSHGHMCPAGDNKWDETAMMESNLLTNMCPQDQSLNSGVWNKIEMDCRKWAKKYGEVYIVCGPVLLNREHETIGENKVVVPEAFFKVILCLNGKPKAIGFVIRNNEGKKKRDQFVNTVDEVERITGYDFFPSLADEIEERVEAYSDINEW